MFINRTWERSEHDDYVLNVEPIISDSRNEAIPLMVRKAKDKEPICVGWKIQSIGE